METNPKLEDKILSAIKSGELKMRPRWHFLLKGALVVLAGLFLFSITLYLTSFIIFAMHRSGAWFVPGFGFSATRVFFSSMPWLLILLALGLVISFEALVKRFRFSYRRPLIYTGLGGVALILVGSFLIVRTPFHENYSVGLYENFGHKMLEEIHPCTITEEVGEEEFSCLDNQGRTLDIIVDGETRLPLETKLGQADTVVILGKEKENSIHARGVRRIEERNLTPLRGRMMRYKK